jgi:hypothetical protein
MRTVALCLLLATGCARARPVPSEPSRRSAAGPAASSTPAAPPAPSQAPPSAEAAADAFVEDDLAGALERARREGKAVFVDAWAPCCHTCLSMKHYVLGDPRLRAFADRVVFAAMDTDREENAEFVGGEVNQALTPAMPQRRVPPLQLDVPIAVENRATAAQQRPTSGFTPSRLVYARERRTAFMIRHLPATPGRCRAGCSPRRGQTWERRIRGMDIRMSRLFER